jgi:hypothetical protein
MKVSRKVGRRSRKHTSSSISRRRLRSKKSYKKNSYRKKNAKTQKGGKRGRGYKRMRAHTNKRGKRFHRGGDPINCILFTENNGNYIYELTTNPKSLYVKKKGTMFQGSPTQDFNVTLSVRTGRQLIQDMSTSQSSTPTQFVVTFKRTTKSKDDGKDVSFSISDLSYFTDKGRQNKTKRVENNSETYDFSDTENNDFFTEITTCIQNQLLKQKQELKAYYEEVKDLLQNCRIIILSSMNSLRYDMVSSEKLSDIVISFEPSTQKGKIPFFSFFLFVYFNTQTISIDSKKTIKLLELFKSLDKYGIFSFSCIGTTSFIELQKLSKIIKIKVQELITTCSSLIDIFTQESTEFTTAAENMRKYNTSLSSLKPSTQQCPTGKVTDLGIKVVGLVRVTEEGTNNTEFLDYDGVPPNTLPTYVDTLPPVDFNPEEYKPNVVQPTESDKLADAKKEKEYDVDRVITDLGENIEAHQNDTTSKVRSFSEFKAHQTSKADELKTKIDSLSIDDSEKEIRKANVDFYLTKILDTQLHFMRKKFRAFYIYQEFPRSDPGNMHEGTTTDDGLQDKDAEYSNRTIDKSLSMLENNVKAFQFRMEKQSENPVGGEYSDLVSTRADDSNYEKLFSQCQGPGIDDRGNATACYKSIEYTPSYNE